MGLPAEAVISCPHCKSELAYTNKDIQEHFMPVLDSVRFTATKIVEPAIYYIVCPICSEKINVNKL